jgi:hypothetical protein
MAGLLAAVSADASAAHWAGNWAAQLVVSWVAR